MTPSTPASMISCPHCGTLTDRVKTCPSCEEQGCIDADCLFPGGKRFCYVCHDVKAPDDSDAFQTLQENDE